MRCDRRAPRLPRLSPSLSPTSPPPAILLRRPAPPKGVTRCRRRSLGTQTQKGRPIDCSVPPRTAEPVLRLTATTKAIQGRRQPCRSHLALRSPRPTKRVRAQRRLRRNSTGPELTKIEKVEPSHGSHLDRGAGGDNAMGRRHAAPCVHGLTPHRRRVVLLRDPPMSPMPYPMAPFRP